MKEYIEREGLIEKLQEVEIGFRHCGVGIASALASGVQAAIEKTKSLPGAEVVEVKHGYWINHFDDLFPAESTLECSVCHEEEDITLCNDNFCPNCGAKMDRKDK